MPDGAERRPNDSEDSLSGKAAPLGEDRTEETGAAQIFRGTRWNHSSAFKAKVAIEANGDDNAVAEISREHDVQATQDTEWLPQLMERAGGACGAAVTPEPPPGALLAPQAKIRHPALENNPLEGSLGKAGLLRA